MENCKRVERSKWENGPKTKRYRIEGKKEIEKESVCVRERERIVQNP